jgi:hypothetical protein
MNLDEWTVMYVEHRDVMNGRLDDYEHDGDTLTFSYTDGATVSYEVVEVLREADLEGDVVVCANTTDNLECLVEHWDNFVRASVQVIFVNPDVNEKWKVKPVVHDKVADPENLEAGLETLQESVPLVANN